jgi:general stress protein YciG
MIRAPIAVSCSVDTPLSVKARFTSIRSTRKESKAENKEEEEEEEEECRRRRRRRSRKEETRQCSEIGRVGGEASVYPCTGKTTNALYL